MSNTENEPLNQDEIERKAAEWGIPPSEYRRMASKKKLRDSS